MSCALCLDTEIRKLRPAELYTLGNILSVSDSWKKLMAIVPKHENVPKFSSESISLIEQAADINKRNAAQMFLNEWSLMGKKKPTLRILLDLLIKAGLFRAADYVACDILKQERPKRPDYGPAASIDISEATINKWLEKQQMLLQDNFAPHSLMPKSTSRMHPCNYTVNNINKNMNDNSPDIHEVVNGHTEHVFALSSKSNFSEIRKETDNVEKSVDITAHYYIGEEVSSDELPVFLNNPEQFTAALNKEIITSTTLNEEINTITESSSS